MDASPIHGGRRPHGFGRFAVRWVATVVAIVGVAVAVEVLTTFGFRPDDAEDLWFGTAIIVSPGFATALAAFARGALVSRRTGEWPGHGYAKRIALVQVIASVVLGALHWRSEHVLMRR